MMKYRKRSIFAGVFFLRKFPNLFLNNFILKSSGAIRAMNRRGERLLLFMGIIDILQSYRLIKKMEHAWKSFLHDGVSIFVDFETYIMKF